MPLVAEHDLELVTVLLFMLSREYRHMIGNSDASLRRNYYERSSVLLSGLEKRLGGNPRDAESLQLAEK